MRWRWGVGGFEAGKAGEGRVSKEEDYTADASERVASIFFGHVGFLYSRLVHGAGDVSFELVLTVAVGAAAAGDLIMLANQGLEYRFFVLSDFFSNMLHNSRDMPASDVHQLYNPCKADVGFGVRMASSRSEIDTRFNIQCYLSCVCLCLFGNVSFESESTERVVYLLTE